MAVFNCIGKSRFTWPPITRNSPLTVPVPLSLFRENSDAHNMNPETLWLHEVTSKSSKES